MLWRPARQGTSASALRETLNRLVSERCAEAAQQQRVRRAPVSLEDLSETAEPRILLVFFDR